MSSNTNVSNDSAPCQTENHGMAPVIAKYVKKRTFHTHLSEIPHTTPQKLFILSLLKQVCGKC